MRLFYSAVFLLSLVGSLALHAAPGPIAGVDLRDGKTLRFDLSAPTTVVAFISARCPCSMSHEALLRDTAKEFPEVSFVAVHSNSDENTNEAKKHFAEAKFSFPVISDPQSKIAEAWGALKTPHLFIVGKGAKLLYVGGFTESHVGTKAQHNYLKEALLQISSGKEPDPAQRRALGCAIRRP